MKKILIIEDDDALRQTLTIALEAENFDVLTASDGEKGLQLAEKEKVDIIALDRVLPTMDGIEICRKLRENGNKTPIIFMTGEKKDEVDRVIGLELGGDDYILKPFGIREFQARIRAILRRTIPAPAKMKEYSFGAISINFKKKIASKEKKELYLTAKEYGLLELLIGHEGEVVSRETILNKVWGYDNFPTTRTIDTFIHGLRQKIEEDPSKPAHLLTVPWTGYKFKK